ncbi:hypothetical protein K435DRAFT_811987 [Dendrothele bispora CBS 962.96]|uniref:Uncharacterized protein n=1 Tax=Dendrothele bispora (strain CBS 962.96) TaxID=1314807 RepID=A0A4S8KQH4_DENBC|nr:hypothetical protein K435DRAFT_811987 [Dendrothele bispora CBS 962.96]
MWDWVSLSDSHVSKLPPVFTRDGSSTGQLVSTLYTPRNGKQSSSDCLTSLILNPHNVFQIITGSSDGFLRVWDYLDATLLKSIDVGQPILHLCAHEKHNDYVFASVTQRKENRNCGGIRGKIIMASVIGLYSSYTVPIFLSVIGGQDRIVPGPLVWADGRNPLEPSLSLEYYAVVLIAAVFLFASLSWMLSARKWFHGPIKNVDPSIDEETRSE